MCVCHPWKRPKNVLLGDEEWQKKIKKENIVQPPRKRPPKMQRLGGRLREVVPYETRTAKAKFFSRPRMEWNIYAKKIMKV